jgi:hypothetical protein
MDISIFTGYDTAAFYSIPNSIVARMNVGHCNLRRLGAKSSWRVRGELAIFGVKSTTSYSVATVPRAEWREILEAFGFGTLQWLNQTQGFSGDAPRWLINAYKATYRSLRVNKHVYTLG